MIWVEDLAGATWRVRLPFAPTLELKLLRIRKVLVLLLRVVLKFNFNITRIVIDVSVPFLLAIRNSSDLCGTIFNPGIHA